MNRETQKDLIREWGHISEISSNLLFNGWLFDQFKKLGRYYIQHKRLCEDYCNGEVPEELLPKKEKQIIDFIEGLNMWFEGHYKIRPLRAEFQHDPRGSTTKVYFTTNKENQYFIIYHVLH